MKTSDTQRLEMAIFRVINKQGVFGCFEVTIGWYGKERVDYITYDTKDTFRCYEVKVTKADFHSPCHNSFVGHYNYYVLTPELYEQIKNEIPSHIGVYTASNNIACCVKKAKRCQVDNADLLKNSLIRSLCREVTKQIKSGDDLIISRYQRENKRLQEELSQSNRRYIELCHEIHEERMKQNDTA